MAKMNVSSIIEEIIETNSRGKELLKDAFIIGLAWGRQILQDDDELKIAIKQISSLNDNIDKSTISPFFKEDKFNEFLKNNNNQLFNIPRLQNQQTYQMNTPQKKLPEYQQPLNNLQKQSPFKCNISPQKGKQQQSSNICQLCNFQIDSSTPSQKAKLSLCDHQFHFLCLYLHTQIKSAHCPICQQQLQEGYPQILFDELPESFKSCCPNLKCTNSFVYFGQDTFFCRSNCLKKWCLKCKKENHDNLECTLDIDHYQMSLGQKYKYCLDCKKVLYLNTLSINDQVLPKHCQT